MSDDVIQSTGRPAVADFMRTPVEFRSQLLWAQLTRIYTPLIRLSFRVDAPRGRSLPSLKAALTFVQKVTVPI